MPFPCAKCRHPLDDAARFCVRCGELQVNGEPIVYETQTSRCSQLLELVRAAISPREIPSLSLGSWVEDVRFSLNQKPLFKVRAMHTGEETYKPSVTRDVGMFSRGWEDIFIDAENAWQLNQAMKMAVAYTKATGCRAEICKKFAEERAKPAKADAECEEKRRRVRIISILTRAMVGLGVGIVGGIILGIIAFIIVGIGCFLFGNYHNPNYHPRDIAVTWAFWGSAVAGSLIGALVGATGEVDG